MEYVKKKCNEENNYTNDTTRGFCYTLGALYCFVGFFCLVGLVSLYIYIYSIYIDMYIYCFVGFLFTRIGKVNDLI